MLVLHDRNTGYGLKCHTAVSKKINRSAGFSMVEVLISIGILFTLAIAFSAASSQFFNIQNIFRSKESLNIVKFNVLQTVGSQNAWLKTLEHADNQIFSCIQNGVACTNQDKGKINIISTAANELYYEADKTGFNKTAEVCSLSDGPNTCPIRAEFMAELECSGTCLLPIIHITGKVYNGKKILDFNVVRNSPPQPCGINCGAITFNVPDPTNLGGVKPKLRVVLVVDNSNSMMVHQANLATGFSKMIEKLRGQGYDITFHIYTTTNDYDDDNVWQATGACEYSDDGTTEVAKYDDEDGWECKESRPYVLNVNTTLASPVDGVYNLDKGISSADFDLFKDKITSSVENVGISGSVTETGLCTMTRTLFDDGMWRVFGNGDKAIFIVISDEDDATDVSKSCYKTASVSNSCGPENGQELDDCKPGDICDVNTFGYTFTTKPKYREKIDATCSAIKKVDGIDTPTTKEKSIILGNNLDSCVSAACTAGEITQAQTACGMASYKSCKHTCDKLEVSDKECEVDVSATDLSDLCTSSFDLSGKTYANMQDYCEQQPKNAGIDVSAFTCNSTQLKYIDKCKDTWTSEPFFDPANGLTLEENIKARADKLFGPGGFMVSSIIHQEAANAAAGCGKVLAGAEAYGKKYENLSNMSGGSVQSICSSDYSLALDNVETFATETMNLSMVIPDLANLDVVNAVRIKRAGAAEINLVAPEDYVVVGDTIQFRQGLLQKDDRIIFGTETKVSVPKFNVKLTKFNKIKKVK